MSKIFFIADTHFGHTNIIKYCNRPFKDVDEMNKTIIDNWNKVVSPDDVVYHLGDFALYGDIIKDIVSKLNGKIYLIKGNHDRNTTKFYNSKGLEVIPTQTKLEEYKLILSHHPLSNEQIPKGYINIHGHIHNKTLDSSLFNQDIHKCVSIEMIDYKPIELNDLFKNL